jgi:hypothetical protein
LATGQPVNNGAWVGLGNNATSDTSFVKNTVTIPVNSTITGVVLNIRDEVLSDDTDTVTATVFTSPCGFRDATSTGISATVRGPSNSDDPNCVATGFGSVPVTQGTLVSVQISTSSSLREGALEHGVAVTIFVTIP